VAALSFVMTLTAATVSAQEPGATDARMDEARRRFDEAERIYEQHDYAGALAEFQRIYQLLDGHPRRYFVLYNVGRCQEQLFHYGEALDSYQRYLAEGGANDTTQPQLAEAARQKIVELQGRLATLTIRTNVDQAEVWVDGRQVATAPGDVVVTGGEHTIELRARGYAPGRQQVQIAARTQEAISLDLDRVGGGISPLFVITGAALTVIAAGVGVGFGATALADHDRIQSWENSGDPRLRYQVTQPQIDAVAQNALIADVFYGAAALFGVASVVLLFVTDWGGSGGESATPAQASFRLTPVANPTSAGLVVEGSF
jgi:hypothetical protein